ncbi:alpha/beta hydrolase [Candidatus Riflebacteria bacterium]
MALITLEMQSEVLQKSTTVKIILPDYHKPPYPVLYLLHGLSDNHSTWLRNTALERYCRKYPFLIVMPDGGKDWYCDTKAGKYETFIASELFDYINRFFPTRKERKFRGIGGLSMGGYGAMKIGLKYPKKFCCISSHSGVFQSEPKKFLGNYKGDNKFVLVFQDENNVFKLAKCCPRKYLPGIYMDCGEADQLFKENKQYHQYLTQLDIEHTFKKFPGGHTWAYWDKHIKDAMAFQATAMGI